MEPPTAGINVGLYGPVCGFGPVAACDVRHTHAGQPVVDVNVGYAFYLTFDTPARLDQLIDALTDARRNLVAALPADAVLA